MADFVFDESCYIRGLYAETTDLADDWLASRLLQLLQVRHRWILTRAIQQAYYHQISRQGREHGVNATALIRSFRDIEFDSDRCLSPGRLQPVPGKYDHDDDHMVEAAAAVRGSLLITLDRKLIAGLLSEDIPARHGFSVLDVSAAWRLPYGGPPDRVRLTAE